MSNTLQMIGAALRAEADALTTVAQNVANAETVGYRRQVPIARAQFEDLLSNEVSASNLRLPRLETAIDFRTATLKSTRDPFHVALDGPGFFVLHSASGDVLTRRGDFHLAADGTLVGFTGDPVLAEKGPIQIRSGVPVISAAGVIGVDGVELDQLKIANPIDKRLQPLGDGTYRAMSLDGTELESRPGLRQGFLESSNVMPVNEMVQLMETVRRFEAEQRFARAYDGMLDKAINELGKLD